ncbi:hypothetical protein K466DRAFT_405652 [Polyporus arcularius HHB13444]|uniref:Uncharacterized protein n=1 Tax=Polyporus arcularius HHB13444 TaxID=1314778 RepID=A0A5C3PP81_9APHY|nr:hypothetical protein K466DRAFT_405652 [Polyporus arcularius HHB13444]
MSPANPARTLLLFLRSRNRASPHASCLCRHSLAVLSAARPSPCRQQRCALRRQYPTTFSLHRPCTPSSWAPLASNVSPRYGGGTLPILHPVTLSSHPVLLYQRFRSLPSSNSDTGNNDTATLPRRASVIEY